MASIQSLPYRYGPLSAGSVAIVRTPLLRLLSEASMRRRVSLLRGAAGSGKTTLLAQWRSLLVNMGKPLAWLSLDAADGDMAVFIPELIAACPSEMFPDQDLLAHSAHDYATARVETTARRLAAWLNQAPQRLIVILDGFEAIDGTDSARLLRHLILHTQTIHWTVASRVRPSLPLAALRARHELFELSTNDLNFSMDEALAFLNSYLPDHYVRYLYSKTDGSPVSMQFARRLLEQGEPELMADSWQEWVYDYYREQILDQLSPDLSHAMSRLVVVECFDLSLAEALVGSDAANIVDQLSHVKGLLLRDKHSRAFHFPEILRSFLESRLEWIPQKERHQLHLRACEWFAQRGMYEEALGHAAKCGAYPQAAEFFGRLDHYGLLMRHTTLSIGHLLETLCLEAPEQLKSQLSLTILRAHEGRIPEARQMAEQLREAQKQLPADGAFTEVLEHGLALMDGIKAGYLGEPMGLSQVDILQRFLASSPAGSHYARALSMVFLGWNYFQSGDLGYANRLVNEAEAEYAGAEGIRGDMFLHLHRSIILFWRNETHTALSEAILAEKMAHLFFPDDQRLHVLTAMFKHGLLLECGHRDDRISLLDLVGAASRLEGWFDALLWGHQYAIRSALADHRYDEARALCQNGVEVGQRMSCRRLVWHMRREEVMAALWQGDMDQAWRRACELGLPQRTFLPPSDTAAEGGGFGWQERFFGLASLVQLHQARGEGRAARLALKEFAAELERTPIPRFQAIYWLMSADLATWEGKNSAAATALNKVRDIFPKGVPPQLLREYGRNLHGHAGEEKEWPRLAATPVAEPAQMTRTVTAMADDHLLTSREREIMHYMRDGNSNKITAHHMGLSEATVKFHLRNIYRKLNAKNRTQALARYRDFFGLI